MTRTAPQLHLISSDGKSTPIKIVQDPLGSGADANIHRVKGHPEMVVKLYHDPAKDPRRPDKIRAMLANPPSLPHIHEKGKSYVQITWPTEWVENLRGQFTGYAMPFVDLKRSTVLENLLAKKTRQVMGLPEFYGYRVAAAANLAALVDALHACGHHIIDLKPVNLNVYLDKFYIALLDCDGLSIKSEDGQRFHAHQYTDGYIAPEALQGKKRPQDLGEDQDRFALAVILFQLLNRGIHPYQGVPRKGGKVPPTNSERIQRKLYAYGKQPNTLLRPSPWSIHKFLEDDTRQLFDQAFGRNTTLRPSAAAWTRHLQKLADPSTGLLKKCKRKAGHAMFTKGCGFCHMEGVVKKKARQNNRKKNRPTRRTVTPTQPFPQRATAPQVTRPPMALWKRILVVAAIFCLIIIAIQIPRISKRYNIHGIIERNDQETFFERAASPNFKWSELTIEDAINAVAFNDQRMFIAIVENLSDVPYDSSVFYALMENARIEPLALYVQRVETFPADRTALRKLIAMGSPELIDSYRFRIEERNDLYTQTFLQPDVDSVREILSWGADPDMYLKNDNLVQKLYVNKAFYPNHIDLADCIENTHPLGTMCRRYAGPFKAPGAGDMRDFQRLNKSLKRSLAWRKVPSSQSFIGRRLSLSHDVHPLTVAVFNGDLEVTRALIAADASIHNHIPNHESIYEIAPTVEIYQSLKSNWKPSNAMEQAIAEDNPAKLAKALDQVKKEGHPTNRKELRLKATWAGSVRCFDMLQRRWKGSHGMNSLEAVFNAYRSQSPLMMAYYLKHIVPYDRIYTYRQLKKASPHQHKYGVFFRYDVVSELADRKNTKIKIGDCLLGMARQDKSWAVAFILDDHRSKWSDLHLAVLAEDTPKIRNLLQIDPARIEERDSKGRTPLGLATQYECSAGYDLLMTFNPNLAVMDKNGSTPIMHAASYGNALMVEDLLEKSTEKNSALGEKCQTVLHLAEKNKEIADHFKKMVSTYQLGGIPPEIFTHIEQINLTYSLIHTACGSKAGGT